MLRVLRLACALAVGGAFLGTEACSGSGKISDDSDGGLGGTDPGGSCVSEHEFFEREVWGGVMGRTCAKCHTPDGIAAQQKAKFLLQPPSYPGWTDKNLAMLRELAKVSYEDVPMLLQKPLGKAGHGGGAVIVEGGPEYQTLQELLRRLSNTESPCREEDPFGDLELMSAPATLRKAAIDLAGRLPTAEEDAAVASGDDAALDAALDGLLREPMFLERVREMYNDLLLTDRGLSYNGAAINFTSEELYPALKPFKTNDDPAYKDPRRPLINRALAREPLDLIAYVVKTGKPFTDVVAADYTVVNPFSAVAYGVDPGFVDSANYEEFKEVRLTQSPSGAAVPHAGVLSTPSFLNRWQTTPTNRNRARARRVFEFFLATDVLKIAERPVDASMLTAKDNPTRTSDFCNVCHQVIDPLAGAFRGFDNHDYEKFTPSASWFSDMEEPGWSTEKLDPSYYGRALQWFGPRLHQDPRFALSVVHAVYSGLTGRKPLSYPLEVTAGANLALAGSGAPASDVPAGTHRDRLRGWERQDAFFRRTAEAFREGGYDFKLVVKAIVKSPYYRGTGFRGTAEADERLADLGIGQILSPESLNRKIAAITGGPRWRKSWEWEREHDWLLEDYKLAYGGIDSDTVTQRAKSPNPIMVSVAARMANELSCRLTAWDFTRPAELRRFFPKVELTTAPEAEGVPDEAAQAVIRSNLQHLHALILGEQLAADDPELARSFEVFLGTFRELAAAKRDKLEWECQGRIDPVTGQELPKEAQINADKSFTIKAWGAVLTYLLSDFDFLHH